MYTSRIFSDQNGPYLNIILSLNKEEANSLISFLNSYFASKISDYNFVNKKLIQSFDRVSLSLSWEEIHYPHMQSLACKVYINFEKLGLVFVRRPTQEWKLLTEGKEFVITKFWTI